MSSLTGNPEASLLHPLERDGSSERGNTLHFNFFSLLQSDIINSLAS